MEQTLEFIVNLIYRFTWVVLIIACVSILTMLIIKVIYNIFVFFKYSRVFMLLIIPVNREKLKKEMINDMIREYLEFILDEDRHSIKKTKEIKMLSHKCFSSCYKIENTELYELTDDELEKINLYCKEYKT